jgi:hypothetical protein
VEGCNICIKQAIEFFAKINRIYEKNQLMLTGFVAMSPVISSK